MIPKNSMNMQMKSEYFDFAETNKQVAVVFYKPLVWYFLSLDQQNATVIKQIKRPVFFFTFYWGGGGGEGP